MKDNLRCFEILLWHDHDTVHVQSVCSRNELDFFFLFSIYSITDKKNKGKHNNIQIHLRSDDTTLNKRKISIRT